MRRRPLWLRVVLRLALVGAGLLVLALGAFFVAYLLVDIPDPNADFQAETSFVYYADGESELGSFAVQNRQVVGLDQVPQHLEDAVIAAEDRSFYENAGIDVLGIARAAWNNLRGEPTQGASTITQQYVKIVYLSQDQTYSRKAREGILALKVQRELPKDDILAGYLNTIYFGRGAYGVQAAADAYFGMDISEVGVREAALLATVLNSPADLDPREGRQARSDALDRYRYVLAGMAEAGDLDPDAAARYERRLPPTVETEVEDSLGGPEGYLMAMVEQELRAEGFSGSEINGGGLRVTTTFDRQAMRSAIEAVRAQQLGRLPQLHIALASLEPGSGAVRAIYGGPDYVESDLNWALAGGQPGSSFKPYALLAGLLDGFSLGDTFNGSSPYVIEGSGETIENQGDSGGTSFGYVSLEYATQQSINTAYVDLTLSMQDGAQKVIDAAELAGIPRSATSQIEPVPVVSLGVSPVPTIDMANAYATFAAAGRVADWFVVEEVADSDGRVVYRHDSPAERVFSPEIASDVSYALQQVVEQGTGTAAASLRCPAAGKTGTATSDGRSGQEIVSSSWFVGYTPTLSTAVMFVRGDGNDALDGYLPSFYGGDYPARTWTSYMQGALEGQECARFPEPAFVSGTPPTTAPPSTT
ncbi:MAG: penicillin-binding protein, partial [Actinomycetota bacterium]|nr:penicillin-binding protein [Actinomycetota bacterium]